MNEDSNYESWLKQRRALQPSGGLTDRIMATIPSSAPVASPPAVSLRRQWQWGPLLLWTTACLIFLARIAAIVGNLAFPTSSYPEFAVEHTEDPSDDRDVSRS